MKLLFVLSDASRRSIDYQHTGLMNNPKRRSVEIELTDEQIEKIKLKPIFGYGGLMEDIESMSILKED